MKNLVKKLALANYSLALLYLKIDTDDASGARFALLEKLLEHLILAADNGSTKSSVIITWYLKGLHGLSQTLQSILITESCSKT
jgi:hypothetical protein